MGTPCPIACAKSWNPNASKSRRCCRGPRRCACEALRRDDFRGFRRALEPRPDGSLGLIAEIKKASPSAGVIAADFDPIAIARNYEQGGADCLSVLTDAPFFQGRLDYLQSVREACALPLLRKDFILHETQIYESICAGADAILLIVAALETGELDRLLRLARDFQLDVLVEVHTLAEMERAVDSGADLIGINNRNLTSFVVDLGTTDALADEAPEEITLVSESGLRTMEDSRRVQEAGADAILVGETLMRCAPAELRRQDPRVDPARIVVTCLPSFPAGASAWRRSGRKADRLETAGRSHSSPRRPEPTSTARNCPSGTWYSARTLARSPLARATVKAGGQVSRESETTTTIDLPLDQPGHRGRLAEKRSLRMPFHALDAQGLSRRRKQDDDARLIAQAVQAR